MKDGLLTQEEYDAKLRAFGGATASPAAGAVPATTAASPAAWATVSVIDPIFKMPAFTVSLPKDWTFEGAVLRGSCGDGSPIYVYRASSPDGLTGIQAMPRVDWFYAEDPRAIKMQGWTTCNLHQPVMASKQVADIAAKARPNPQIGPVETVPTPKVDEFVAKTNKMFDDQARANGQPKNGGHMTAETARVRLHYDFQGHPEEELFSVQTMLWDLGVSVIGTGAYGIIKPEWARGLHTQTFASSYRAPAGRLESSKALLDQISASVKLVPEYEQTLEAVQKQQWDQAQAASNAAFHSVMKQGEENQASMTRQHNAYMAWQQQRRDANNQQFQNDMARKDSNSKNFLDYVGNQQYYMNPETGGTVTVQNVPGATGVVAPSTINGNWVQLVPISH